MPEWPPSTADSLIRWSLWTRGKGVISHDSALSAHQIGDVNPAEVHLTVPPNFRAAAKGVRLHRGVLPAGDIVERQGFRLTTPLRTLLDIAAGNLDTDQLATAIRDALEAGLVTRRQLLARADSFGDHAALRIERALAAVEGEA